MLSLAEREEISRGLASGGSMRAIAARLGGSASTVSREINRNGGRKDYRATLLRSSSRSSVVSPSRSPRSVCACLTQLRSVWSEMPSS